ncbi:MAG: OST-HTH/LOTUS domain-containing protein, partial [Acidimicrobiia bacterium]
VIGVGLKASTSKLLPPACDEFLFYENLDGLDLPQAKVIKRGRTESYQPTKNLDSLSGLVSRTLGGLQRSSDDEVRISQLKRALLRKDSTFSESDYGFRSFSELMRNLQERGMVQLDTSSRKGDPVVSFPEGGRGEAEAFELLASTLKGLKSKDPVAMSGLKDEIRKSDPDFSERQYGYGGFLQFVKAANAKGVVDIDFDPDSGAYSVSLPG